MKPRKRRWLTWRAPSDEPHYECPSVEVSSANPLGRTLLGLADRRTSRRWIRRRVDRVVVLDERTLTREVTLYCDLSRVPPADRPFKDSQTLILPIDRLPRREHVVTTAQVFGTGELMRPTRDRERALVTQGLREHWSDVLQESTLDLIEETIRTPLLQLRFFARRKMRKSGAYDSVEDRAFKCAEHADRHSERPLSAAQRRSLLSDVVRWQKDYLLLIELPIRLLDNDRVVVVVTMVEPIPGVRVFESGAFHFRRFLLLFRKAIGGSLSWAVKIAARRTIGVAESSHVNVEAPEGFRAVEGRLRVKYRVPGKHGSKKNGVEKGLVNYRDDDRLPGTAHVFVETTPFRVDEAWFIVSFYSYKTGFFTESLVASWVLFAVQWIFYDRVAQHGFVSAATTAGFDSALSAALILLLPAAVVTLISQRDSHRIASKCFAVVRFLLAMSAISSVAAASMLALQVSPAVGRWGWRVTLWVSGVVAIRLTVGAMVHIWRTSRIRGWIFSNVRAPRDYSSLEFVRELMDSVQVDSVSKV
jgi:hypothetical protein